MVNIVMENPENVAEESDANVEQEENPISDEMAPASFIKKMRNGILSVLFVVMMAQTTY